MHGVTFDGQHVWFASGDRLNAFDPESGKTAAHARVAAHAGTAFDGQHLFQIAEDRIQKIDPETGRVLATIPAPGGGGDSGLAWAEGTLWVGQYRERKIHRSIPQTGEMLRTIEIQPLRHRRDLGRRRALARHLGRRRERVRRIDPGTGEVLEQLEMPPGTGVSGLESDGGDRFFCGGGSERQGESGAPAEAELAARDDRRASKGGAVHDDTSMTSVGAARFPVNNRKNTNASPWRTVFEKPTPRIRV